MVCYTYFTVKIRERIDVKKAGLKKCRCMGTTEMLAQRHKSQADLAKERERQLMMARANQTTGLTNGRVANRV